jgi:tetratricopeptide (TPR) repeat protein
LSLLFLLAIPLPGVGQQDQNATLESLLAAAQQAQASSNYAAAANAYKQAVKIRPEIPELWANLGLMEHETADYAGAIQSFQHACQLKPSLYVPNLFLGIDLVHTNKAKEAIPYLLTAEKLNSADLQPHLALGRAYSSLQQFSLAAHEFALVIHSDPKQSSAWFSLGIAYLDQVEADARKMSEHGQDSPYAKALFAESLVNQSRYSQAVDLYKEVLVSTSQPPCIHGELGFVFLKQHDNIAAAAEFEAGHKATPACALSDLGQARLSIDADNPDEGLRLLTQLWKRDPGFLQFNAYLLSEGMSSEHSSAFSSFLTKGHESNRISSDLLTFLTSAMNGAEPIRIPSLSQVTTASSAGNAEDHYALGEYRQCANQSLSSLETKNQRGLRLLTACSLLTGDYELSSRASAELATILPQSMEPLYWSVKADEKLAFEALQQYEQLEPHSERSHLLLGDIYVQRERYDDALAEYQKALDIAPDDPAALLGLASAYFRNANISKTIETAQQALNKVPDDPEINLLMGEALVARHDFSNAEPFLKKGLNAKPQMVPHVHALLGKVYAEAGRTQEGIEELTLGLTSDEDGSVHYQLARLYRETGDTTDAAIAIEQMKAIQQKRRENAVIAFKDSHPSTLDDEP